MAETSGSKPAMQFTIPGNENFNSFKNSLSSMQLFPASAPHQLGIHSFMSVFWLPKTRAQEFI